MLVQKVDVPIFIEVVNILLEWRKLWNAKKRFLVWKRSLIFRVKLTLRYLSSSSIFLCSWGFFERELFECIADFIIEII